MLGNFSFGDYFKKEAIVFAWEFLTKNMALPKDKLYITVYKDDFEAAEIWGKIVPGNRIIKMEEETNFWNMGNTGPCGPCSEILIDLGPDMSCGKDTCGPDCNCDRYLEVWNLVFTQYDKQVNGSLKNLPRKNIDTGMGLERLVAVTNGKKNVFETDLFVPIIEHVFEILKITDRAKNVSKLRMIADHLRAITFLISDGVLPSNEGRGYVLRRVLRRALRQGKLYGRNEPFINELISTVFKIMEPAYPELSSKLSNIQSIVKMEEEKFLETLESGSEVLSGILNSYKVKGINIIEGKDVFKLYDTYGFPYDLTKEIALENGLIIDEMGFNFERKNAQEKARSSWSSSEEYEKNINIYSLLHKKNNDTVFIGYNDHVSEGKVLSLINNGKQVNELKVGDIGEIVLTQTSFYAQSGGQNADKGEISNNFFTGVVEDVFKPIGNLFVHKVKVVNGSLKVGDNVSTIIDVVHRKQIARHHTATHILHKALREAFGENVSQAGSLVTSDYLRFDFTHFLAIKKDDLIEIEKKINSIIRANSQVCVEIMSISKARDAGAMALFGEKYGDVVRTVSIKSENGKSDYSMELCGGTHVSRTGDIGVFKIISESSVAAGIRRIEANAGISAENYILDEEFSLTKIAQFLNVSKKEIIDKVQKYIADYKKLENEYNVLKINSISNKINSYIREVREINGITFLSLLIDDADVKTLRNTTDQLKEQLKSVVLLIASEKDGKISFVVSVTADYVQKGINAGAIAKAFAAAINGSGGGKTDFAQGGSKDTSTLYESIKNAQKYIVYAQL
jgi:alanyl-tRNA synthetase